MEGILKSLAKMEARHSLSSFANSHTVGGKTIYGYTATKYVTDRINEMFNNSDKVDQLLEIPYSSKSAWLHSMSEISDYFGVVHLSVEALKEMGKSNSLGKKLNRLGKSDHDLTKLIFFQDTKNQPSNTDITYEHDGQSIGTRT